MADAHRTALIALYAALSAALALPVGPDTRRALRGALAALGRDLGLDGGRKAA